MIICENCNKLNPFIENIYYDNNKKFFCFLIKCNCNNKITQHFLDYRINKEDNLKSNNQLLNKLYDHLNKVKNDIKNKFKQIYINIEEIQKILNNLKSIYEKKEKEFYYKINQFLNLYEYFKLNINYPEIKNALNKFKINNEFNINFKSFELFYKLNEIIQSECNYVNNLKFKDEDYFMFKVYNITNKKECKMHNNPIYSIIKLNSINKLASCSGDYNINIFNNNKNFDIYIQLKHNLSFFKLYEIKKDKQLVSSSFSKIIIWDLMTFQKINIIELNCNIIWEFIGINSIEDISYVSTSNYNIVLFDKFFDMKFSLEGHKGSIRQIIQIHNKNIVSCSWDGYLMVWDLLDKKNINKFNMKNSILQLSEINTNKVICYIKFQGIKVVDVENGTVLNFINNYQKIYVFLKDKNNNIISVDKEGNLCLINKNNYNILFHYENLPKSIKSGCLLKNNHLILGDKKGMIFDIQLN